MSTRVWIDTEFNGYDGDLISIALVDAYGRSFYESVGCANPEPWVAANVMPVLDREPIALPLLQLQLSMWLLEYPAVHVVADWPDDIKHFCRLLITGPGRRIETPPISLEIRRDIDGKSQRPHNALADAFAIRDAHLALEQP